MSKKRRLGEPQSPPVRDQPYTVTLVQSARKELLDLPEERFTAVTERLNQLRLNPRPTGSQKLTARTEYKLRVGDMRVIYAINDQEHTVVVIMIDDRKQVYRRLRKRK